ncbi:RNA polymerase sigma factor [Pseudenhygromyxa sp. WMMC2535]|uniref:RNA polymerase sigma factor n=1 Tax=Pseudenhygromyxa sp. WMMC2535 TaxID=2712867 RepID=UPI00155583AF|nr:RNA polymerase sigma factor [Pseudenhygromyxa sp. WMMC2535]NVB38637.1 RNA polymerase sigma factor [Pseudenhygromyxa sp. WMMC2535]
MSERPEDDGREDELEDAEAKGAEPRSAGRDPDLDHDPDLALFERWRGGDREAGGRLVARYFNDLRVYFLRRLPEYEPEELIQETFLRMISALERFEGRATVRSFLFGIARHLFYESLRGRARKLDTYRDSLCCVGTRGVLSESLVIEELGLLSAAMDAISIEQLEVIDYHYFYELSQREVAAVLGIPEGTVKSRLRAAREALVVEISRRLGVDAKDWCEEMVERGLTRLRDVLLRERERRK